MEKRYYLVEETGEILETSRSTDKYWSCDRSIFVDRMEYNSKTLLDMTKEECNLYRWMNQEDRVKWRHDFIEWVRQLKQNDLVIYKGAGGDQIGVIERINLDNYGRQTFILNLVNGRKDYYVQEHKLRQMKDTAVKYYRGNDTTNVSVSNVVLEWNNTKYIYPKLSIVMSRNISQSNLQIMTKEQFQRYTLRINDKCLYRSQEAVIRERNVTELGIFYKLINKNTREIYDEVKPYDIEIQNFKQLPMATNQADNLMASQISVISTPSACQTNTSGVDDNKDRTDHSASHTTCQDGASSVHNNRSTNVQNNPEPLHISGRTHLESNTKSSAQSTHDQSKKKVQQETQNVEFAIQLSSSCHEGKHHSVTSHQALVTAWKTICCIQDDKQLCSNVKASTIMVPATKSQWKSSKLIWKGLINKSLAAIATQCESQITQLLNSLQLTAQLSQKNKQPIEFYLIEELPEDFVLDDKCHVIHPCKVKEMLPSNNTKKEYRLLRIYDNHFVSLCEVALYGWICKQMNEPMEMFDYWSNSIGELYLKKLPETCCFTTGDHMKWNVFTSDKEHVTDTICCIERLYESPPLFQYIQINKHIILIENDGPKDTKCVALFKFNSGAIVVAVESKRPNYPKLNKLTDMPDNISFYSIEKCSSGWKNLVAKKVWIMDSKAKLHINDILLQDQGREIFVKVGEEQGVLRCTCKVNSVDVLVCEMENDWMDNGTNGTFGDKELFKCKRSRAIMVPINQQTVSSCYTDGTHQTLRYTGSGLLDELSFCCKVKINTNIKVGEKYVIMKEHKWDLMTCKWTGIANNEKEIGLFDVPRNSWIWDLFRSQNQIYLSLDAIEPNLVKCDVYDLLLRRPESIATKFTEGKSIKEDLHMLKFTTVQHKSIIVNYRCKLKEGSSEIIACQLDKPSQYGVNQSHPQFSGLFDCQEDRGVFVVIEGFLKTCANGDNHSKLECDDKGRIKNSSICCFRSQQITSRFVDGDIIYLEEEQYTKGTLVWQGSINNKPCLGIELRRDFSNEYSASIYNTKLFQCKDGRAFITELTDNIKLHLELIANIYVSNDRSLAVDKREPYDHPTFKINDVVQLESGLIGFTYIIGRVQRFVYLENDKYVLIDITNYNKIEGLKGKKIVHIEDTCKLILVKFDRIQEPIYFEEYKDLTTKDLLKEPFEDYSQEMYYYSSDNFIGQLKQKIKINGQIYFNLIQCIPFNPDQSKFILESKATRIDDTNVKYIRGNLVDLNSICRYETIDISQDIINEVVFSLRDPTESFEGNFVSGCLINKRSEAIMIKLKSFNENLKEALVNRSNRCKYIYPTQGHYVIVAKEVVKAGIEEEIVCSGTSMKLINPKAITKVEDMDPSDHCRKLLIDRDLNVVFDVRWRGFVTIKSNKRVECLGIEHSHRVAAPLGKWMKFKCSDNDKAALIVKSTRLCDDNRHNISTDEPIIQSNQICCVTLDGVSTEEFPVVTDNPTPIKWEPSNAPNAPIYGSCLWIGKINGQEYLGINSELPNSNWKEKYGFDGKVHGLKIFDTTTPDTGYFVQKKCCVKFPIAFKYCPTQSLTYIDSFSIENIENGRQVDKYIIVDDNTMFHIRWKGVVNGQMAVGCELDQPVEYGTTGIFFGITLFYTKPKCAVLITNDDKFTKCVLGDHNTLNKSSDNIIKDKGICCLEICDNIPGSNVNIQSTVVLKKNWFGSNINIGTVKAFAKINNKSVVIVKSKEKSKSRIISKLFAEYRDAYLFADVEYEETYDRLMFLDDNESIVDIDKVVKVSDNKKSNIQIDDPVYFDKYHGQLKCVKKLNRITCAGIDLEERPALGGSNGKINDVQIFQCDEGHGVFVPLEKIKKDDQALDNLPKFEDGSVNFQRFLTIEGPLHFSSVKLSDKKTLSKNNEVFAILKRHDSQAMKIKCLLKSIWRMNRCVSGLVEACDKDARINNSKARYWRKQLIENPDPEKIYFVVEWQDISPYQRYETKDIPLDTRKFEIKVNEIVMLYHRVNDELLTKYGTVKWIGYDWDDKTYLYGIELDDIMSGATDGCFHGQQLFSCQSRCGFLAHYRKVAPDIRFAVDNSDKTTEPSPICEDPVHVYPSIDIETYLGTEHGIQGNTNSCYFDSTIFALFLKIEKLDFLFTDIHPTCEITSRFQKVLANNIVYPLRKHGFVSYHHTKAMRDIIREYGPKFVEMVDKETDMSNMSALLSKLSPERPLLKLISYGGRRNEAMFLQLFITLDQKQDYLSTETMLELSMIQNQILLEEDPAFLIFQAPRDNQTNFNYQYVLPAKEIEVSRICGKHIRKCSRCSELAIYSCIKCCFHSNKEINTLMAYKCENHKCNHDDRNQMTCYKEAFTNVSNKDYCHRPVKMHLRSIISIEKCHFVSFVKDCDYLSNKWMYFDSMATQKLDSSIPVPEVKWDEEIDRFMALPTIDMEQEIITYDTSKLLKIIRDAYVFVYENIVMSVG